jgi:hypothetical protein
MKLPTLVKALLTEWPSLICAGGAARSFILDILEPPNDIDFFAPTVRYLEQVAFHLKGHPDYVKTNRTKNAITVHIAGSPPLQFITRWLFTDPNKLLDSFDFTICQAAIWSVPTARITYEILGREDYESKTLTYRAPHRIEDPTGSLMRAIRFVRQGYYLPQQSLASLVARAVTPVVFGDLEGGDLEGYDNKSEVEERITRGLLEEIKKSYARDPRE